MDEQVAKVGVGVHRSLRKTLAEIFEEDLSSRRLAVKLPALVAGTIEGDVASASYAMSPPKKGGSDRP